MKLSGIVVPMVTPVKNTNRDGLLALLLDVDAVHRLVNHLLAGGVHGIFILGTAGEGVSCSYQVKVDLIRTTCAAVQNRVPVLVGVTDTCWKNSLDLAQEAKSAGATAVVLAPPCYFPLQQNQLERYFLKFCEASPLPVLLYNIPVCAHNELTVDMVRACKNAFPNKVIGVKDSSGDKDLLTQWIAEFKDDPDFSILVGTEETLVEAVTAGADGGVCCLANVVPDLYVQLYESASGERSDNDERTTRMQEIPKRMRETFARCSNNNEWSSLFQGMKAALEIRGIVQRHMLPPLESFDDQQTEQLREELKSLWEEVKTLCADAS